MSAYTGSGAWTAVETAYLRDQLAVVPQTEIAEHLGMRYSKNVSGWA
jgi:hypothetical protein